jgi:hypothetical protein
MAEPQKKSMSMSETIKAKSNQMNADDLIGQTSFIVKIEDVDVKPGAEQPVTIYVSGGFCPWKPCKTERRVLVEAWGDDAGLYIGRHLELVRDSTVLWAGKAVGGIRIQRMSHIRGRIVICLNANNKKKMDRVVDLLEGGQPSVDPFITALVAATKRAENSWTREQITEWLLGGRKSVSIPSYERPAILERVALPPAAPIEEEPSI